MEFEAGVRNTPCMEPQAHRTDREAMLADHQAAAELVERKVDETLAAAAAKRREYDDHVIDRMRAADRQPAPGAAADEEAPRLLLAAARAAEDVRVASRRRALHTLTKARERARKVDLNTEQEAAKLAELRESREQLEREREQILEEPRAEAARIMAAAVAAEQGAAETERAANELLARARTEAAASEQERREQADREAREILTRARAEAGRTLAAADEERSRVRNLLTGALASLDPVASIEAADPAGTAVAASSADLVGDLSSRLQETDTE